MLVLPVLQAKNPEAETVSGLSSTAVTSLDLWLVCKPEVPKSDAEEQVDGNDAPPKPVQCAIQDIDKGDHKSNRIINCLLYTSPSPRDRTRSRMPSSA